MPSCMMMMSCILMGLKAFWIYEINHILFHYILIMFKCYVIMLNARAVLSTQCPVMLKCYAYYV